jgi:hypothetical protein
VKAIVIYESMFGDNRQVALAIVAGLAEAGVEADAVEVGVAPTAIADDVDLVVVGSPNHAWSMPRTSTREDAAGKTTDPLVSQGIGVREWLETAELREGQYTAAYDTRGSRPKAVVKFDHASASIEKGLARLGGRRAAPAEHFFVVDMKGPLQPGELERAQTWGSTLGRQVLD